MILNLKKLNKYIFTECFAYDQIRGLDGFCGSQRCILFCRYSLGMQKIFKMFLGVSSKTHSYAKWQWTSYESIHKTNETSFFISKIWGTFVSYICRRLLSQGDSFIKCTENVIRTIGILEILGFYIKTDKSEIIPKQQITSLGLINDSFYITIRLINENKQNILNTCTAARLAHTLTIWKLTKLIGNLVASMEAVPYGRVFMGNLKGIKLNLFNRTKVILKQILHFQISPKKNSLAGKIKL